MRRGEGLDDNGVGTGGEGLDDFGCETADSINIGHFDASSRMTTASKSPGMGSPVSTISNAPAASGTGVVSLAPTVSEA